MKWIKIEDIPVKWVKVSNIQVPEGDAPLLLYSKQADCYWSSNDCGCDTYHEPTHWMRLPGKPE